MDSGYYAASTGLRSRLQALDLIANNLSNLHTAGFRAGMNTFSSLLAKSAANSANPLARAINDFGVLGNSHLDLSAGNLERTDNPADLAIEGPAFFAVHTPAGTFYTRQGNFQASARGQLVTAQGDPVLGQAGPITVPSGTLSVSADGTISAGGAVVDKLKLLEFAPGATPIPQGSAYYSVSENDVRPATTSSVRQGMIESSNVNPLAAMAELITVQRQADMFQRAQSLFYGDFHRIAASELPRV